MEQVREGDVLDGKYRVEHVIGRGGMGTVVSAVHEQLGQRVALKVLLPDICSNRDAVDRFLREARATVQIRSEHVARVSDVGTLSTGAPYMVMEFLQGSDLAEVVRTRRSLPPGEAVDYILQACEALAEAHELGIVHRDLKPGNLFLTQRPDRSAFVKVLDFGISKMMHGGIGTDSASATASMVIMGSPQYMSPEQALSSKDVDERTDIWALGSILHEMLCGQPVFRAESPTAVLIMISTVAPTPIRALCPGVPAELENVILRCLRKNREARYPNIAALARALRPFAPEHARASVDRIARIQSAKSELSLESEWLTQPPNPLDTAGPWGHTHRDKRRSRAGLYAGVAIVACGLVAAGIVLATRGPAAVPSHRATSGSIAPASTASDEPLPIAPTTALPEEPTLPTLEAIPSPPAEPTAAPPEPPPRSRLAEPQSKPAPFRPAPPKPKSPSGAPRRTAQPKDLFDDPN